jgi:hypothetical protein
VLELDPDDVETMLRRSRYFIGSRRHTYLLSRSRGGRSVAWVVVRGICDSGRRFEED